MKKFVAVFFLILFHGILVSQDVAYARKMLEKLTSPRFHGRGYVDNGVEKAGSFIAGEFKKDKLQAFGNDYFQNYTIPVNTFPKKVFVSMDGEELIAGKDFVISSSSPSVNGEFQITFVPSQITSEDSLLMFINSINPGQLLVFPDENFKKLYGKKLGKVEAAALLTGQSPYWHVSNSYKVDSTAWLKIQQSALPLEPKIISLKAENEFIPEFETRNVIGYVSGSKHPEQFVVLTAHYDHLGMMGKTLYPGANDNASGTAMLLDLAKYYSKKENQPELSLAFIAFSGEETGLNGSKYFVEHPLLPLEKIQMVINLDMVGTGSEGITVVNGELFPDVVKAFEEMNSLNNYVPAIKIRGESCNSDHCPFYQKGVKSIFIYTMGPEHSAYHTPEDGSENLPFTAYAGLFKLLTDYIQQIN